MIVCVTGPDGSGKSTQVDALARRLRHEGRSVAVSRVWDLMLNPETAGRTPFKRPVDADRYLELLDPTSRMYFLCHALHASLERALATPSDVVLLNAYWYKYYATEVAHGGHPGLLRAIAGVLPEPDVTFYLRVRPSEAARRKDRFTGYETGFASGRTARAFETFQLPAARALDSLAAELGWIVLFGNDSASHLTDRLLGQLAELGAGHCA